MLTINNTLDGYLKDVEIKGNTIQNASNLADIRSVGDKIEGQELYEIPVLSCGKNLFDGSINRYDARVSTFNGYNYECAGYSTTNYIKVKGNTPYTVQTGQEYYYAVYDKDKKHIGGNKSSSTIWLSEEVEYIRFDFVSSNINTIQIEEGTQATPYEPYVEDKLTILSPTPLEKVGDVCDRLIEKDGVWGVEKHIKTDLLKGGSDEGFGLNKALPKGGYQFTWFANMGATANKNSEVISSTMNSYVVSNEEYSSNIWIYDGVAYVIHHPTISTADEIKLWLQANPTIVKFALNTPQFIPLPHNQQIKLRTFANKTNISFGCEIEGTIKAQVPKSIGATVNTHTEQINNLNKELDRVKKLEESTVSTVTTESDFTTVEATSNGYFEDVKLEGKTLVNIVNDVKGSTKQTIVADGSNKNISYKTSSALQIGKEYTFIVYISKNTLNGNSYMYLANSYTTTPQIEIPTNSIGLVTRKITISNEHFDRGTQQFAISKNMTGGEIDIDYYMILEGDHTQNPPNGYIEGLKSVGDGVDEVSVESATSGNMIDLSDIIEGSYISPSSGKISVEKNSFYCNTLIPISPNMNIVFRTTTDAKQVGIFLYYDKDKQFISGQELVNNNYLTIPQNTKYLRLSFYNRLHIKECLYVGLGDKPVLIDYQSDKKRLLYYNEETQTWEKPILREWDSIEKHADGKYYYHQRSAEVVLNGSENWNNDENSSTISPATYRQSIQFDAIDIPSASFNTKTSPNIISDLLPTVIFGDVYSYNHIGISISGTGSIGTHIIINNNFIDVTELKQWLQANNLTLVYQLAEEKVYECTNIDLITYNGETNFIVESGVLSPKTTLKVHNNISNVVRLLQKKVSLLESNVTSYMTTQNRLMLASRYNSDTVSFKVDYAVYSENMSQENYDTDLYNLILNNILVGKDNYDYDHMFNIIMDYASWSQISWDQFDILVGLMDIQHNPPIEEIPTDDEIVEEIPNEIM